MNAPDTAPAPAARQLLLLLCVSVPSFMINLDSNIVAVSLPSIARSLHADFADMEWVISAYTLTFASLVMPAGSLADRYGRKRMLLAGLFLFTLASFICGAATSAVVLNGARALQGVGAALQLSAALAILSHGFRGAARARAFAFWGSVIGVAITLGPVAGGLITQHLGWQWAFYVNVPVGVALIALVARVVVESADPEARRLDLAGVALFSLGLFCLTLALISGNRHGWDRPAVGLEAIASLVLLAGFVAAELMQARPMLDLRFFRRPTYLGATIASVAFAAALLTMLTYLPIYFQSGLGYRPEIAGLAMLPMAVPLFVVPRLVTRLLTPRVSGRVILTAGLALVALGLLWMGLEAPALDYPALLGGMLVAGCGAGILNGETTKVAMTVIPPERAGMASGVGGTVRFAGIVVGFAGLGALLHWHIAHQIATALPAANDAAAAARLAFIHQVVAGNLAAAPPGHQPGQHGLALASFGGGYGAILLAGAAFAALSALACWLLVRAAETAPTRIRPELGLAEA